MRGDRIDDSGDAARFDRSDLYARGTLGGVLGGVHIFSGQPAFYGIRCVFGDPSGASRGAHALSQESAPDRLLYKDDQSSIGG